MTSEDWLSIAIVLICVILSAFFAGSETALTASSRASMHRLEKEGDGKAAIVNRLSKSRSRVISALLVGNNVVNIVASSLATSLLLYWVGGLGVLYATVIMAAMIIVFGEVLPKTAALIAPDRIALVVARPVDWTVRALTPVLFAVEWLVRGVLRLFGMTVGKSESILTAHEQLRGAVDLLHREGGVEKLDRDMLSGLLDLRDLTIADVMIHRTEMITVCADDPNEEVVKAVLEAGRTRIPLWSERPENIIGVLHAKDLLRAIHEADGDLSKIDVKAIARLPWFVPEIRPLSEQMKAFRRRKTPFALVVDEYGELMGLVTIEDILEEIVGDITDEHDVAVPGVRPQPDGSVNVDGAVPIRDLNRAMDWNLPDDDATTIAGLVIHEARSIPEPGQSFTFHGFRFRVLRKRRNRITALRITPLARKLAKAG
ncbi:MAG TPA: HlyC/CorC family transporter [Xanthobacteraceae bacterium]|jgi:Mg2+/Co2+ transporter CorB